MHEAGQAGIESTINKWHLIWVPSLDVVILVSTRSSAVSLAVITFGIKYMQMVIEACSLASRDSLAIHYNLLNI